MKKYHYIIECSLFEDSKHISTDNPIHKNEIIEIRSNDHMITYYDLKVDMVVHHYSNNSTMTTLYCSEVG